VLFTRHADALVTIFNDLQKFLIEVQQGVVWFVAPPTSIFFAGVSSLWADVRRPNISQELYCLIASRALPIIIDDLESIHVAEDDLRVQQDLARMLLEWTMGEEISASAREIEQTVEWQTLASGTGITEKSLALQNLVERGFLGSNVARSWLKWFTDRAAFYQRKQEAGSTSNLRHEDTWLWGTELDYHRSLRHHREGRIGLGMLCEQMAAYLKSWHILDDLDAETQQALVDVQMKLVLYQPFTFLKEAGL